MQHLILTEFQGLTLSPELVDDWGAGAATFPINLILTGSTMSLKSREPQMYILTRFLLLLSLVAFSFSTTLAQTETTVITGGVALQLGCCDMSFNLTGQGFAARSSVAGYLHTYRDSPGAQSETFPPGSSLYVHNTYDDFFGTNKRALSAYFCW